MYRHLTRTTWFVLVFAVLLAGGAVLGQSLHQQGEARGELNLLRAANSNLELVTQARLDDVLGQSSLAFTPAEDEDIAGHAERLRSLTDHADPELERLLDRIDALDPADAHTMLMDLAFDLDALVRVTTDPVRRELDAAVTRGWWAFWLTGATLVALLLVEARRPDDAR